MIISNFYTYLVKSNETIVIEINKVVNPNQVDNDNTGYIKIGT